LQYVLEKVKKIENKIVWMEKKYKKMSEKFISKNRSKIILVKIYKHNIYI